MNLQAAVEKLLEDRGLKGLDRRKAETAVRALVDTIGNVDTRCLQQDEGGLGLGSLVCVPGDEANWVVTGEYSDGTFDICREGGTTLQDRLVGWKPGQSLEVYFGILTEEFDASGALVDARKVRASEKKGRQMRATG